MMLELMLIITPFRNIIKEYKQTYNMAFLKV